LEFKALVFSIISKSDGSVVTKVDRNAEAKLREILKRRFPEHGIIGEEFGNENENAEFVRTLDPINGTIDFIHGTTFFGTIISLLHHGKPILGAIHQPILNQLCIGNGQQTWLNGRLVKVNSTSNINEATLLNTDFLNVGEFFSQEAFDNLTKQAKLVRTCGNCYGYLLLVSGYADAMFDPVMNFWDLAPLIPIVEGAGGTITDWQGQPAIDNRSCVAATPGPHSYIINNLG